MVQIICATLWPSSSLPGQPVICALKVAKVVLLNSLQSGKKASFSKDSCKDELGENVNSLTAHVLSLL